jgi:hypothetical protein
MKRLRLHKETVLRLDHLDSRAVAGGVSGGRCTLSLGFTCQIDSFVRCVGDTGMTDNPCKTNELC